MLFFLNSGNSKKPSGDQCRRQTSVIGASSIVSVFLLPLICIIAVFMTECECQKMDTMKKASKVDNSKPGEVLVRSNVLTVKSFDRKLEERGTWKSAVQNLPELGRSETIAKSTTTEKTEITTTSLATTNFENETTSLEENSVASSPVTNLILDTTEAMSDAESVELETNDEGGNPESQEDEHAEPDKEIGEDENDDTARSAEENIPSSESQESREEKISSKSTASPKTTARTMKPTPTLKLIAKSTRTTYPFLKKVPAHLVAKPAPKTTPEPKRTTTKKPLRKGLRPSTPIPEHFNPHHPHGVVVFDKRKRRPKPGRSTTTKPTTTSRKPTTHRTTTTTTTTATKSPASNENDEDIYDSDSDERTKNNSSSNSKRPGKVPLSKLAMAMIASSTNFDNGSDTDGLQQYPKTPVNLLHLLQAYTKQMHLANSQKVEALANPVRIQSTPFMLHLSQLNFAAKLGISIYYSLIAIIPLVYLAFGGLGRIGFLNGFGGKKRRRKRSTFNQDHFYEDEDENNRNYKKFNRKAHFQLHTRGGSSLRRGDLRDDDGNEEEYAWIMSRISEIMLEFSMLSKQASDK